MHSVGPSASSWWTIFICGLSDSSMSMASLAASTRGPDRYVSGDGGGTLSAASQRSSARLPGSWSSSWLRNVVPARNMPTTISGASMCSSRSCGCRRTQSWMRSRFTSPPITFCCNANWPSSLSWASSLADAHKTVSPSTKASGPKSSDPASATAADMTSPTSNPGIASYPRSMVTTVRPMVLRCSWSSSAAATCSIAI